MGLTTSFVVPSLGRLEAIKMAGKEMGKSAPPDGNPTPEARITISQDDGPPAGTKPKKEETDNTNNWLVALTGGASMFGVPSRMFVPAIALARLARVADLLLPEQDTEEAPSSARGHFAEAVSNSPAGRATKQVVSIGSDLVTNVAIQMFGEKGQLVQSLLNTIADYEAVKGRYDSAWPGTTIPGLEKMTLNEVIALGAIRGKEHGSSAMGRYQFMRTTLIGLKKNLNLTGDELFTPELQDKLAIALLEEKGLSNFLYNNLDKNKLWDGIAEIWQGIENSRGVSPIKNHLGDAIKGSGSEISTILAQVIKPGR